jgi:NitT/TauT family transport system substrate-binding protein
MAKTDGWMIGLAAGAFALSLTGRAMALDEVSFGTNWLAEAEHGGFYQAVADGTYEKYGLKVTIVQGGPNAANQARLMADKIQFFMQGNLIGSFSAVEQDIPVIEVAAIFQKDPQVLITHPESGLKTFADLAKVKTLFLGKDVFDTDFQWMKQAFPGFRDEQVKTYTFSPAPFLADKDSAQQGYVTSEPYEIEKQGGFKPQIFLLADNGFSTYSTMIEAKSDYVAKNRDIVKRFVEASIIGWYHYLWGDNKAANDLIKKDNPDMTDGQIAFSIDKIKEYHLVDGESAAAGGIGCMTSERVKDFFDKMVKAGVVKAADDYTKIYTTDFVCKKLGMELKK